jgi:hypothetical protein
MNERTISTLKNLRIFTRQYSEKDSISEERLRIIKK